MDARSIVSHQHSFQLTAEARQLAWPLLVGRQTPILKTETPNLKTNTCVEDRDSEIDLIHRDAGRSVLYQYYKRESPSSPRSVTTKELEETQPSQQSNLATVLETMIASPLSRQQGKIHYYQGLHDVAGVMLFNLGDVQVTSSVMRKICQTHFRDALRQDFQQLTWLLDKVLLPLIDRVDPAVHDFLAYADVEMSSAVLPWIITWFSHDIHKAEVASRLFDAFISSHPLFPLYFATAMLIHPYNKQELIYSDSDPAMIYMTLRTFPSKIQSDWEIESGITAQDLLDDALHIMRAYPPRTLLKLAATYDNSMSREEFICKACGLSILKAPPSWAFTSTAVLPSPKVNEKGYVTIGKNHRDGKEKATDMVSEGAVPGQCSEKTYHKAKIASGVEFLMKSVPFDTTLSRRVEDESPRKSYPMTIPSQSKWSMYTRLLFGSRRGFVHCSK